MFQKLSEFFIEKYSDKVNWDFISMLQKLSEKFIEKLFQVEFTNAGYHIYIDGGMEFYNKKIKDFIIPRLKETNVWFEQLTNEELLELERQIRIKYSNQCVKYKIDIQKLINYV